MRSYIMIFLEIEIKNDVRTMKIRNPRSRFDLQIGRKKLVLDIGGGNNPHPRANIVVDKYPFNNYHRSENLRTLKKQKFVVADGENLPFKNKAFDYVVCCQPTFARN